MARRSLHRAPATWALIIGVIAVIGVLIVVAARRHSASSTNTGGIGTTPWSVLTASGQTHYPVTIRDCNGSVTFTKAPTRMVSLDDETTDTLVEMGLANRIVGVTKFETPSQEWPQDAATVSHLHALTVAQNYPSLESILALHPDFVLSNYASAFSQAYGPATPARWASFGVHSYQTVSGCGLYSSHPLYDFNLLYTDIHNLGVILNKQSAASQLIQQLQGKVVAAQTEAKAAGVGNYDVGEANGGTQGPGTLGVTLPNAIIAEAGSTYALVKYDTDPNTSVSWEQFVKADPHVIWLITDSGYTVPQMIATLEHNPQLKNVDAIVHHRYVPISYFAASGPRVVQSVQDMIDGLIALKRAGNL